MKKYLTKKMVINNINDLNNSNKLINGKEVSFIINQLLINKVFRSKKRFKNKYDSKSNKFYIFKGKVFKTLLKDVIN